MFQRSRCTRDQPVVAGPCKRGGATLNFLIGESVVRLPLVSFWPWLARHRTANFAPKSHRWGHLISTNSKQAWNVPYKHQLVCSYISSYLYSHVFMFPRYTWPSSTFTYSHNSHWLHSAKLYHANCHFNFSGFCLEVGPLLLSHNIIMFASWSSYLNICGITAE